jgi:small conductance mechanosensitive channel
MNYAMMLFPNLAISRWIEKIDHLSQYRPIAFLLTLFTGLLIILVGKLLLMLFTRILRRGFRRSKRINDLMGRYTIQLVDIIGWIFLAVIFLQHMGLNMGPVLAGLGITGVILGFAFQETLGNLLSGVMIVINSPFRIGDYIEAGSYSGTVTDMDMICVTLSTPDNKKITMSNKLVWSNPIVNYSDIERRRVELGISIALGSDVAKAKEVIASVLQGYSEILLSPAPVIEATKITASSIDIVVRPWVKPSDYWKIHFRFNGEIYDRLTEAGIKIPHQQMDLHIVQQN